MRAKKSHGFTYLALLMIAVTAGMLVFLIPGEKEIITRALTDLDLERLERLLTTVKPEVEAEHADLFQVARHRLALQTHFLKTGIRLDDQKTLEFGEPFLKYLENPQLADPAKEGLARTLALSDSIESSQKLVSQLPEKPELRAAMLGAQKAAFLETGNPAIAASVLEILGDGSTATTLEVARLWRRADQLNLAIKTLETWFGANPGPWSADATPLANMLFQLLRELNLNSQTLDFILKHEADLEELMGGEKIIRMLAVAALASGEGEKVLGPMETWLNAHPGHPDIWLKLSDIAMAVGNPALASHAMEQYVKDNPDDKASQFALGKMLEWGGKPNEAFDAYLPLAKAGSAPAMKRLMALYPGLFRGNELIDALPGFLPKEGTSEELMLLAELLVETHDYEYAKNLYRQHLKAEPNDLRVILELAQLDMVDEIFDEAYELYSHAAKLDPEDPYIAHALVKLDYLEGRYDGIVPRLGELARKTKDEDIIQEYYSAAENLGDLEALVEAIEMKLSHAPKETPDHYRNLAYYNSLLGRTEDAKTAVRRGMENFEESEYFRTDLAYRLSAEGNFRAALELLEGRIGPDTNPAIRRFYAEMLSATGRRTEALRFIQESLAGIGEQDANLLSLTGSLLEDSRRFREAESYYRRALALAPESLTLKLDLARSLGAQGREREMNTVIASIDTNANPLARRDIAQLYMDVENYPAAAAMLRKYLSSDGGRNDTLAWRMLGDCTLSKGDPVNAKRAYRRALAMAVNFKPETAKAATTP